MLTLTPFLLFDGDCADAMRFYQSCLGGELQIILLGETPMGEQAPPGYRTKVAYAHLKSQALEVSATDWQHPTRAPTQGNTVGLYLSGATYDQLRPAFEKLSIGGDPDLCDELRDMPFGTYGHLADKYGVHWFFRGEARGPA
jgi:PhnB protein